MERNFRGGVEFDEFDQGRGMVGVPSGSSGFRDGGGVEGFLAGIPREF